LKKTIYTLLIISAALSKLYSQQGFADSAATWNVYYSNYYNFDTTRVITVDSTFNSIGKVYQKIGNRFYSRDSLNRIYAGTPGDEYLLYDFSKNVGDTIFELGCTGYQYCSLVDSIDSIFIGHNRKRMFVWNTSNCNFSYATHYYNDIWIEGIGSQFNRFLAPYDYCGFPTQDPTVINLLCYFEQGQLLYHNINYDTCFYHRGDECDISAGFALIQDTLLPHYWTALTTVSTSFPPVHFYKWTWGDGNTSTTATPSHVYNTPGNYNICLSVIDGHNCEATYCGSSTYIYKNGQTLIEVNCVSATPTGLSTEIKDKTTLIYPNPADRQLTISMNGLSVESVSIYNTTGKLLLQNKQPINNTIDISSLSSGVYIAEIRIKEGSVIKRWVKM
jgi:hypothetical protein